MSKTTLLGSTALTADIKPARPIPNIEQLRQIAEGMRSIPFMALVPDRRPGAKIGARMPAVADGVGDLFAGVVEALADARERIAKLEEKA
jgi:hypothetical protein